MTPLQAYKYFGGQTKLARKLGLTRQAVDNWKVRKHIPLHHQITLHSLSGGFLEVTLKRRLQT